MDIKVYKQIIDNAILEFSKYYSTHPFVYVYEADIQSCLYHRIRKKLEEKNMFESQKTVRLYSFSDPPNEDDLVKGKTSLLHCQTTVPVHDSNNREHREHYDIGIWKEEELDNTINYMDKAVSIAIEIKYHWESRIRKQYEQGFLKILSNFLKDIDKLKQLKLGYAIWCLPNVSEEEISYIKEEVQAKIGNSEIAAYLISTFSYYGWKFEMGKWTKIGEV